MQFCKGGCYSEIFRVRAVERALHPLLSIIELPELTKQNIAKRDFFSLFLIPITTCELDYFLHLYVFQKLKQI